MDIVRTIGYYYELLNESVDLSDQLHLIHNQKIFFFKLKR
jgi:hypothetical protein